MIEDRNIRIFLSSTFADMQEERNYLVKKTLPALYTECKKRNVELSVVDLRWGITEEESKTGKVIEICLDEIERTRPFFIGIVGGRYGWIPSESEFKINEHLLLKYPWIKKDIDEGLSITELEMQYGALKNCDNVKSFFFLRDLESVPKKFREEKGSSAYNRLCKLRHSIELAASNGKCKQTLYKSIASLGNQVYSQLFSLIEELYPIKEDNQWAMIDQKQKAAAIRLSKTYTKRNDIFFDDSDRKFPDEIDTNTDKCLLLFGESGYGKTALISSDIGDEIDGIPVYRAIIDDELNSIDKLYRLLLYQISIKIPEFNCPEIYDKDHAIDLNLILSSSLTDAYRFYWVIDGLERLESSEDLSMYWINSLPQSISLILSSSDLGLISKIKYIKKDDKTKQCTIPPLGASSIMNITSVYLKNLSKVLTTKQRSHICAHPVLINPRLLELFLNSIATFGEYEKLNDYIDQFIETKNIDEFIAVFLNRLVDDFGDKNVYNTLSLLSLSQIGVTEQQLRDYLNLAPIDFCSILNAIEPIVKRSDSHLIIVTNTISNSVCKYLETLDKSKENQVRKYIIKCRTIERKELTKTHNYSFWYKTIIKMLNGRWLFVDDMNKNYQINSEIRHQLVKIGKVNKAYAITKNMGIAFLDASTVSLFKNHKNGLFGLLSIWALPIFFKFDKEMLGAYLKMIRDNSTQAQNQLFKRKIELLLIFQKCRKFILNELQDDNIHDGHFERQWSRDNCTNIDPANLTMIANQILTSTIYKNDDINNMLQMAAPLIVDESLKIEDELIYANFCLICCCCHLRLNNISEAIHYYSLQESCCGGYLGNCSHITRFMIAIKNKDFQTCTNIMEQISGEKDVDAIFNRTRFVAMIMDAKGQSLESITSYLKGVAKNIEENDDKQTIFMAVGSWLYIWDLIKIAKESFLIALNACSDCPDKRINCYVNLANCSENLSEKIGFLKERFEFACEMYKNQWRSELTDYANDYLGTLKKESQQDVCNIIDTLLEKYQNLPDNALMSFYNLKGCCMVDIYDKQPETQKFDEALLMFNQSLKYASASEPEYYIVVANRLSLLTRKNDCENYKGQAKQDETILVDYLSQENAEYRESVQSILLDFYFDTDQIDKARGLFESSPLQKEFSPSQTRKILDSYLEDSELLRDAQEKIQRFKDLKDKGDIKEITDWISDEKSKGYNFGIIKSILQMNIQSRNEVAICMSFLYLLDIYEGNVTDIPDDFYREYLFEPDMYSLLYSEATLRWEMQNHTRPTQFSDNNEILQYIEEVNKEVTELSCEKLLSLCNSFNLSSEEYLKVFLNYSTILGNKLPILLDLIDGRNDAASVLNKFIKTIRLKSYDICRQIHTESHRIQKLIGSDNELESTITEVVDDCAHDIFNDGDKAEFSVDLLVEIVDVLKSKKMGNYTLYMVIKSKFDHKDWHGVVSTYHDYAERSTQEVFQSMINLMAAISYGELQEKGKAESIFSQLIKIETEMKWFFVEKYGRFLIQASDYHRLSTISLLYVNNKESIPPEYRVQIEDVLSIAYIYLGKYEEALAIMDAQLNEKLDDKEEIQKMYNERRYKLILFYARQHLDSDALKIFDEIDKTQEVVGKGLKIRVGIELTHLYERHNDEEKASEMRQMVIDNMTVAPFYLQEYEDFVNSTLDFGSASTNTI